jgi:hypothetical protein
MINIAISLAISGCLFLLLFGTRLLGAYEALVPCVIAAVIAYIFLARRIFRKLEAVFVQSAQVLQTVPPKFDVAIATMERAYTLVPWQIGIRSQIDTQIGIVYFLQREFSRALPYLQRSLMFGHWMGGAMLGVVYYKKKNFAEMHKTFQVVCKRAKKQSLPWSLYAYLRLQTGDRTGALRVLNDGLKACGPDERLKENLLAVQNDKKMKMRGYKEQWYQFHLERPPAQYQQQNGPPQRVGRAARRGRW